MKNSLILLTLVWSHVPTGKAMIDLEKAMPKCAKPGMDMGMKSGGALGGIGAAAYSTLMSTCPALIPHMTVAGAGAAASTATAATVSLPGLFLGGPLAPIAAMVTAGMVGGAMIGGAAGSFISCREVGVQNESHVMVQLQKTQHPDGFVLELDKAGGRYRPQPGYNHHVHPPPHYLFDYEEDYFDTDEQLYKEYLMAKNKWPFVNGLYFPKQTFQETFHPYAPVTLLAQELANYQAKNTDKQQIMTMTHIEHQTTTDDSGDHFLNNSTQPQQDDDDGFVPIDGTLEQEHGAIMDDPMHMNNIQEIIDAIKQDEDLKGLSMQPPPSIQSMSNQGALSSYDKYEHYLTRDLPYTSMMMAMNEFSHPELDVMRRRSYHHWPPLFKRRRNYFPKHIRSRMLRRRPMAHSMLLKRPATRVMMPYQGLPSLAELQKLGGNRRSWARNPTPQTPFLNRFSHNLQHGLENRRDHVVGKTLLAHQLPDPGKNRRRALTRVIAASKPESQKILKEKLREEFKRIKTFLAGTVSKENKKIDVGGRRFDDGNQDLIFLQDASAIKPVDTSDSAKTHDSRSKAGPELFRPSPKDPFQKV